MALAGLNCEHSQRSPSALEFRSVRDPGGNQKPLQFFNWNSLGSLVNRRKEHSIQRIGSRTQ